MRRLLATALLTGVGLALPLVALGQTPSPPVIAPVTGSHAKAQKSVPVWQRSGNAVTLTADGGAAATVPGGATTAIRGEFRYSGAGIKLTTRPGLTAHAGVKEIRWAPLVSACAPALAGAPADPACLDTAQVGMEQGEVGAGFAGHNLKLDVSLGQSRSVAAAASVRGRRTALPQVLPAAGGADVAAPLWFRNSTATDISAHGQVRLAPDTHVDVGASMGRVHFLPAAGLSGDDTLDQTTLSLGIQHGNVRGAIVGHLLDPNLPPGAPLDQNPRWSSIDLGISVRLPWRGELNFGAQNLWTSGHAPLLFGPANGTPAQGRVPYVQYHQDL